MLWTAQGEGADKAFWREEAIDAGARLRFCGSEKEHGGQPRHLELCHQLALLLSGHCHIDSEQAISLQTLLYGRITEGFLLQLLAGHTPVGIKIHHHAHSGGFGCLQLLLQLGRTLQ